MLHFITSRKIERQNPILRYNLLMQHSYEEVRQFANELPEDERLLLAGTLLEGLAKAENDASEAEIAAAWDEEIARRVAEIKAGSAATCSLAEVEADLRTIVGR